MANVCLLHSILLLLAQLSWKHVVYAIEWPISCIDTTKLCITASAISDLFQLLNFYSLGARSRHNHFVLYVFFCVCMSVISILFTWFPLTFFGVYFFFIWILDACAYCFFPFHYVFLLLDRRNVFFSSTMDNLANGVLFSWWI